MFRYSVVNGTLYRDTITARVQVTNTEARDALNAMLRALLDIRDSSAYNDVAKARATMALEVVQGLALQPVRGAP